MSYESELAGEQKYFDHAWDERDRHQARLKAAPGAAAGSRAAARGVRKGIAKIVEGLPGPDEEVAFGRVDLDRDGGETWYLGKHAILTEDREVLVVNWQIPEFADFFYKSSIADPLGVVRKRTFECDRNQIQSFEDVRFADLRERVEELTADEKIGVDDVLLRDLAQVRDGEMRDIVRTIHASQYDLIRRPLEELLVIQGGPGTGKTAVALHRASWLLFNHRDELTPSDVLVVGPSKTFNRYIAKVLPGLGNEGVAQRDVASLGPITGGQRAESLDAARLKGTAEMAVLLRRALHLRVRFPERALTLSVGSSPRAVDLAREEVEARLSALRDAPSYNAGRAAMREWLTSTVNRRIGGAVGVDAAAVDAALERVWPQLTPAAFLQDLLGSRQRITAAAGDEFRAGDVERLYRPAAERLAQETWSLADVALLDEADTLINGTGDSFKHVIVDEAQDLSPMQLRSVRRRSQRGSYTIVGDIAQSTGAWARASWADAVHALDQGLSRHEEVLEFGFRVPSQVMELADRLLPLIAPDLQAATVIRSGPSEPQVVSTAGGDVMAEAVIAAGQYASKGQSVGIVCADGASHAALVEALRDEDVSFMDAARGQLGSSINVMTAEQAKGLEFDAAVVVEPADIAAIDASGLRHLYIALTRTTKHLTVVHSRKFELLDLHDGDDDPSDPTAIDAILGADADDTSGLGSVEHDEMRTSAAPATPRGSLQERAVVATAGLLAEEVRATLQPEAFEALVRALAAELDVDLSSWPGGQLF